MTDVQQAVPVAQEDRELFIFLLGFDAVKDEASFDRIRAGEFDGWKKMQMIARHRLDATQTREAELVAALKEARELILELSHARGCEYEGTDEDIIGFIDVALNVRDGA